MTWQGVEAGAEQDMLASCLQGIGKGRSLTYTLEKGSNLVISK